MMYTKVLEEIARDKSFKEIGHFIFASDKYKLKMIFSKGPHCKEVRIYSKMEKNMIVKQIKDLETLRRYFYLGRFDSNIRG